MRKTVVSIYTILHFLVDLACAHLLYHLIYPMITSPVEVFYAFLLYNFFAFAVQFPIGILADFINKNAYFAAIGCLLVALAYSLAPLGIFSAITAGIGNACFHIGGGIDILNLSKGKASLPGIFVSSGALGIFLGTQKFLDQTYTHLIFIGCLIIGAILSLYIYQKFKHKFKNTLYQPLTLSKLNIFIIFCLCLTVFLRSYTGFLFAFEWKKGFEITLCFTLGIILGKMLGGILSDKFGMKQTSIFSLTFSALCFYLSFQNNMIGFFFGTLGVLLFNMTMPITLTALSNLMPKQKGMAFGLLTFMLFLGALPTLLNVPSPFFSPIGLSFLILLSLALLLCGLFKTSKE